ncbi:MAG: L-seryl-tRNA(Sec) selenium transferase [bacterium]|nr:L-seryl-tRNA(Sec) selenium transferase [bacterium]
MLSELQTACLRSIPSVESILQHEMAKEERFSRLPRWVLVEGIRQVLDLKRKWILSPQTNRQELEEWQISASLILDEVDRYLQKIRQAELGRVINATGIILHTNLGRAVLASEAMEKMTLAARCFTNLEFDLITGTRGKRGEAVTRLLCHLSGAQDALVVNNNAAAVLLVLNTLAEGRQVIVSRGELVEIGGSFRVPEIMKKGGVRLVEVGTTNKTRLDDYRQAITSESAAILKVHPSNFQIVGFSEEANLPELVHLGQEHGLVVIYDLGSGMLADLAPYGLSREPLVSRIVQQGVDIITFSGDKLLGGPQAGIILCRPKYGRLLRQNPLARAVRADKMTLAALEGTLRLYSEPDVFDRIPTLRMITASRQHLEERGRQIMEALTLSSGWSSDTISLEIVEDEAQVGGGSFPQQTIPSLSLAISSTRGEVNQLEERFRLRQPPILGRINQGRFLLSLRTIQDEDIAEIIRAAKEILGQWERSKE